MTTTKTNTAIDAAYDEAFDAIRELGAVIGSAAHGDETLNQIRDYLWEEAPANLLRDEDGERYFTDRGKRDFDIPNTVAALSDAAILEGQKARKLDAELGVAKRAATGASNRYNDAFTEAVRLKGELRKANDNTQREFNNAAAARSEQIRDHNTIAEAIRYIPSSSWRGSTGEIPGKSTDVDLLASLKHYVANNLRVASDYISRDQHQAILDDLDKKIGDRVERRTFDTAVNQLRDKASEVQQLEAQLDEYRGVVVSKKDYDSAIADLKSAAEKIKTLQGRVEEANNLALRKTEEAQAWEATARTMTQKYEDIRLAAKAKADAEKVRAYYTDPNPAFTLNGIFAQKSGRA
ncbi:hypothetical protein CH289_07840 [Rhodococcus sp. RS1C4]|nr:hypothetical protein [Rhodococcus sp. RS1C4]OZC55093.1 hypothetical protein CH289_07840 [Rhodococcus sp. RS1C4]